MKTIRDVLLGCDRYGLHTLLVDATTQTTVWVDDTDTVHLTARCPGTPTLRRVQLRGVDYLARGHCRACETTAATNHRGWWSDPWRALVKLIALRRTIDRLEAKLTAGVAAADAIRYARDLTRAADPWELNRVPDPTPALTEAIADLRAVAADLVTRLRAVRPDEGERDRALAEVRTDALRNNPHLTLDDSAVLVAVASTRHLPRHTQQLLAALAAWTHGHATVCAVPRWAADQLLMRLAASTGFDGRIQAVSVPAGTSDEQRDAAVAAWLAHRDANDTRSDLRTHLHATRT